VSCLRALCCRRRRPLRARTMLEREVRGQFGRWLLVAVASSSGRARETWCRSGERRCRAFLPIRSTSISVPRMKQPLCAGCCVNGVLGDVRVGSRPSLACSSPRTRRGWRTLSRRPCHVFGARVQTHLTIRLWFHLDIRAGNYELDGLSVNLW
jgi:hypothetical protein